MRISSLSLCGVLASFTGVALSHNIQMGAHSRECFHEQLHKDDKMTVTFQVGDREFGGAGNLEIDFWVSSSFPAIAPPKPSHIPTGHQVFHLVSYLSIPEYSSYLAGS